jgi:tRNA pseudouridine38-40 synthase
MRNIKLTIRYDGTAYAGWQTQSNARTIQETLEKAIGSVTGEKASLIASGRTDAGVHAEAQVANFRTCTALPLKNIRQAVNSRLPKDIVISRIEKCAPRFNARHDAKSKTYRYILANGDSVDPFMRHYAAKCFYSLNIRSMRQAARHLMGRHDFSAFRSVDGRCADPVRKIKRIRIEKEGKLVYIYMEADSFLYNMARAIVGTLVEAGRGKIRPGYVKEILRKKERGFCGPTAPAKGLCLVRVRY